MNRNVGAWIGAAVLVTARTLGAATAPVVAGEILIPEVSGVAFLPGDRLLVVADDPHPKSAPVVFLLDKASEHLKTGKIAKEAFQGVPLSVEVNDLEDVALDGARAFLVTSHSLNKDGEVKPKRSVISRLTLEGLKQERLPALQIPPEFDESRKLKPVDAGFNIEGAAWSQDGHLLLGLRAPTNASTKEAILLEVEKPDSEPLTARVAARLDLKGNGIRGMFYDRDAHGLWILAGVSPDLPDGQVKEWALWFRQDDGTLKQITALPSERTSMINAEAVTRVSVGCESYLLVVEDGAEASHYLLFPVPQT